MKKLFIFMLAIMVAFFCVPVVNASDTPSIEHYSVVNTTATATHEHIGVTTIYPGKDRILGYTVGPITSGTGTVGCGLYDAITDATMTAANLMGERSGANTATYGETFIAPISLENGLTISLGPYTMVVIYYEKTIGR